MQFLSRGLRNCLLVEGMRSATVKDSKAENRDRHDVIRRNGVPPCAARMVSQSDNTFTATPETPPSFYVKAY